jgi:hypothetical protein
MPNDTKTLLMRKATVLGQLSRLDLPPFPSLPPAFVRRFPELQQFEEDVKRWSEQTNHALSKLSAPKT